MRVALTGTPGVGKTSLAALAAPEGWRVVDVKAWAREAGAVVGHDAEDDADVIDLDVLATEMPDGERVLLEGHLAHLLPVDAVLLVRVDPGLLRARLESRGYAPHKVAENLEAEALDIILQEALETGVPVVQRDGTRRSLAALWQSFAEALAAPLKRNDLEAVDWSDRLPL